MRTAAVQASGARSEEMLWCLLGLTHPKMWSLIFLVLSSETYGAISASFVKGSHPRTAGAACGGCSLVRAGVARRAGPGLHPQRVGWFWEPTPACGLRSLLWSCFARF